MSRLVGRQAAARFDFKAQEEDELDLKSGDIVRIVQLVNNLWWMCRSGDRVGIAPVSYLELLVEPRPKSLMDSVMKDPGAFPGSNPESQMTNVVEVTQWLESLGMQKFTKGFLDNGYDDLDIMEEMTYEDLDIIGVTDEQDCKKILAAAALLRPVFGKRPASPDEEEEEDLVPFPFHAGDSSSIFRLEVDLDLSSSKERGERCGYLSKQGGANKSWKKRWVVFRDMQIRYYKGFQDKEPAGAIHMTEVISVYMDELESRKDPKYPHCFCLSTIRDGRIFVFCSESDADAREWVSFLQAKTCPIPELQANDLNSTVASVDSSAGERNTNAAFFQRLSVIPSGGSDPPDKCGWLKKMGNNMAKDWKRRFVAIKASRLFYYFSYERFLSKEPINFVDLLTTTVKPSVAGGRFRFEVVTFHRSYWFQAESQTEMMEWVLVIQDSIAKALSSVQSKKSEEQLSSGGKTQLVAGSAAASALREVDSNRYCADCGLPDPEWASINLGIVVCIECSGIHRGMGVHISKVRSLPLDEWSRELLTMMRALGNESVNNVWLANVPPEMRRITPEDDRDAKKAFIVEKYKAKAFLASDWRDLPMEERDRMLFASVKTPAVIDTAKLFASGANLKYVDPETGKSLLHAAVEAGRVAQLEFLLQNGANPTVVDVTGLRIDEYAKKLEKTELASWLQPQVAKAATVRNVEDGDDEARNRYRCGYLHKTGGSNKFWKRRWFIFDEDALRYFRAKEDKEPAGIIMLSDMTSISAKQDPSGTKSFYFELESSLGRTYELAADNQSQMLDWLDFLRIVVDARILSDSFASPKFDLANYAMHGFLNKRVDSQKSSRQRWFLLQGKHLYFFMDETHQHLLGSIDLRLMTQITWTSADQSRSRFFFKLPNRTYYLEAKTSQEASAWVKAIKETTTFGVPLEILSKRKGGSHDKGVPLFLLKSLAFVCAHCGEVDKLFEAEGDPLLIQSLKVLFDQDDLSMNLHTLTTTPVEVASVAQLIKIFFAELPEPLIPDSIAAGLIKVGRIEDEAFLSMGCEELLKQIPEWTAKTLKKLVAGLGTIARAHAAEEGVRRLALGRIFGPLAFRIAGAEVGPQVSVLVFLMKAHATVFKDIFPEVAPLKPARPAGRVASLNIPSRLTLPTPSPAVESVNVVEVSVDAGESLTFPISDSTTAHQLTHSIVKKILAQSPGNLSTNYSLFEVTSEYERVLEDTEKVWQAITSGAEGFPIKLVFKLNPLASLMANHASGFPDYSGWLYKEGVTVKSWKKRFCVLKQSGLYYYKDPKTLSVEKGYINFLDLNVCLVHNYKKAPTSYCFALRHRNYKPGTGSESTFRVLCADTAAERDTCMAVIIRAKTYLTRTQALGLGPAAKILLSETKSFDLPRARSRTTGGFR